MEHSAKIEQPVNLLSQIQDSYDDSHWSKTYGVTPDELKTSKKDIGISAKIIEANFKNKSFNS